MDTTIGAIVKVFLSAVAGAFVVVCFGACLASCFLGFWGPMYLDFWRLAAAGAICGAALAVRIQLKRRARMPRLPETFEEFRGLEAD
jgi:integral membrane sensor domain MASE1